MEIRRAWLTHLASALRWALSRKSTSIFKLTHRFPSSLLLALEGFLSSSMDR
jgi:hypothetical protein